MIPKRRCFSFPSIPEHLSAHFCLLSAAAVFILHALIWAVEIHMRNLSWLKALEYWDGAWYSSIIKKGYTDMSSAFFPLYPLSVKIISSLLLVPKFPQITGTIFSSALFFVFCRLIGKTDREKYPGLVPQTSSGWLFFLFWPGTFIFHSHHTEASFLLLSWLAVKAAYDNKTIAASLLAGLTALTRVPGSFLSVAVALILTGKQDNAKDKAKTFLLSGLISFSFFCLYPLYQFLRCGNALAFLSPHLTWTHPTATLPIFLQTFIMANPWQTLEFKWLLRQFFAFVVMAGIVPVWKNNKMLAGYALISFLFMPVQGEFANVFRFSAVLFPVLFAIGDKINNLLSPRTKALLLAGMLAVNLFTARDYILSRWSY